MDPEYRRNGTASVFMMNMPLEGRRQVRVREHRKREDFAEVVRELCDELYPDAEKIVLVMDNLNTHNIASLYEAFPAVEARRLAEKLEIHYTPKHGSWLNIAEIELSLLTRRALHRRIDSFERLVTETSAWASRRNEESGVVRWQFRTGKARIKLLHLYPELEPS